MGKTILVSSHILPELADICNKIGIIERGKLEFNGDVAEALAAVRPQTVLQIRVRENMDEAERQLSRLSDIEKVEARDGMLVATLKEGISDPSFVADTLVAAGLKLTLLREEEVNLETAFMRLTKGITN